MSKKAPQTVPPTTASDGPAEKPDHETIALRAYELWVSRGCPIGSPEVDWECAEQELASKDSGRETAHTHSQAA